ncbi:hypothetical protein BGZ60DRAFT_533773 [Tricladium varicosporioides]|nr:hypothetical protein BGZ60DRAFT_533773 [Hymenoscyphus varicosporioides]
MQILFLQVFALVATAFAATEPTLITVITRTIQPSTLISTILPTTITSTISSPQATGKFPNFDGGVCQPCPNKGATTEKEGGCPSDHPTFYYVDRQCSCCPIANFNGH